MSPTLSVWSSCYMLAQVKRLPCVLPDEQVRFQRDATGTERTSPVASGNTRGKQRSIPRGLFFELEEGKRGPRTSQERRSSTRKWRSPVPQNMVSDCTCFLMFGRGSQVSSTAQVCREHSSWLLPFSATIHDLSFSKSPERQLHHATK